VEDRGKLNATRSIIAAISDELREEQGNTSSVVDFLTEEFPEILEDEEPIPILSTDGEEISPEDFEIKDFVQADDRPDVYGSAQYLIDSLNAEDLAEPLRGSEVIGIDESKVDTPLPQSALSLLRTVAFRMFKDEEGNMHEAAGPIVNEMRHNFSDDEAFSNENELIGYIRNNFVAYASALMSKAHDRDPFVVLHGPLIRAIGGFSRIDFDYSTAKKLLNIDLGDEEEVEVPDGEEAIEGDEHTTRNLPLDPTDALDGSKNLKKFNQFCGKCQQCKLGKKAFRDEARPKHDEGEASEWEAKVRRYPGLGVNANLVETT
jgi:hypothetical protein